VRDAAVQSNTHPDGVVEELRPCMTLIQGVAALQAHSQLRYAEWRQVVAEYAADRFGCAAQDPLSLAIGAASLAASTAAFRRWVDHPEENILDLIYRSYALLALGFDVARPARVPRDCPASTVVARSAEG
jgi:hypothetical protein